MRIIGKITTALVLAGLAGGVIVLVKSIPDLKRYARIRAM